MGRVSFKLPDVGEGIAEAEIVAWHVSPGSLVSEDQPLVDVMTDKATVEITSPVTGRVLELLGDVGRPAAVGATIAVFEVDGSGDAPADAGAPADAAPQFAASAAPEKPRPTPPLAAPVAAAVPDAGLAPGSQGWRPLASPSVRRRATVLGLDLRRVVGSGPGGRILHNDLDATLQAPRHLPPPADLGARVEEVPVIGLRRRIAERMSEAKRRIPHFTFIEEVDVTELERLRARLNSEASGGQARLSALPFIARALIRALPAFPQFNARYDDEVGVVRRHEAVHLGVAVQTIGGLLVPVVRHAESLDLWELAAEITRLAEAARSGKASREELGGSTITITSLGPLGGVATTPVINHPEVAIVGPNRIVERAVVVGGSVVVRKMMNLSCSFDHRVVDGWDAAELVQRIKSLLETPALLFVDRP